MSNLDRRKLFQLGLGGLASSFALSGLPVLRAMERAAGMANGPRGSDGKLLMIFMRGGMDGVLAVIPQGDTTYPASRNTGVGSPFIPPQASGLPNASISLGGFSSFAELNPAMAPLLTPLAQGDFAMIHQVGNHLGSRSHFTEMARMETGEHAAGAAQLPENGWVPGISTALGLPASTKLGTVSVSKLMQRLFQSVANPQVHLRSVPDFAAGAVPQAVQQHLNANMPTGVAEQTVDSLGDLLVAAQMELASAPSLTHDPARFPLTTDPWPLTFNPSATSQTDQFFKDLEGALHLLKHTKCRVAGVELGGFDTHSDELTTLNGLLELVAFGMNSVWEVEPAILSVAMSEFGRGAHANGNNGTDHGKAGVILATGEHVNKGVFNCSNSNWTPLGPQLQLPPNDPDWNAVPVRTHYLAIFDEILQDLFNLSDIQRSSILPGLATVPAPLAAHVGFL